MDSLPVPLLIQCLLYLIGNLFDDDDKPIPGLALLPRSIRIKFLLLLPAVDVHKLEGTSVTADIVMDEIWETLYKERKRHQLLDKHNSLFSCKDLYFSAAMVDPRTSYLMFYEANKELSVYFTHVKKSVYDDYYKIATFHNVIRAQHWHDGVFITTKTFKSEAIIDYYNYNPLKVLALTMIDLHIPLKIVTDALLPLDHDILVKLTQSAEAIHWTENCSRSCNDIIGDLPNDVELISDNVNKISDTQVDFIKIGVYDPKYINTLCSLNSLKKLIAVFFADKFLPNENDLKKIKDSGFYGVMIDTSNKNAGNIFNHTSINNLNIFIKKSEKLKLLTGIAGSVNETHIDKLIRLNPNYIGFRGALCENKNIRASNISKKNVINIINLVNHSKNLSISA